MEGRPRRRHAVEVPRLVVLWTRPNHLTREEADDWVRSGVVGFDTAPGVTGARVAEVHAADFEHPAMWHWMLELELEVTDHATVARTMHSGALAEWLRDLRLLGMRPTVLLVASGTAPAAA